MITPLPVGAQAPEFSLRDQHGKQHTLASLTAERSVLLVFFPFAFSGVCAGELRGIRDNLGSFDRPDAHVVAVSCDPMFSLRAWDDEEGYFFPLLSDHWPHGLVSQAFGVFDEQGGFSHRGSFLVDRTGVVQWQQLEQVKKARDFSEYLRLTHHG